MLTESDIDRLKHILAAAEDAVKIVGHLDANDIAADMIRTRALVNCFTVIGEAAGNYLKMQSQNLVMCRGGKSFR